MKAESNIKPDFVEIEIIGDRAEVTLRENIREEKKDGLEGEAVSFIWDEYKMLVPLRDGLEAGIRASFSDWLFEAKERERENLSEVIRKKRNELLKGTDQLFTLDHLGLKVPEGTGVTQWIGFLVSLGKVLNNSWARYRQELRDIPQQEGFPYEVKWPKMPLK